MKPAAPPAQNLWRQLFSRFSAAFTRWMQHGVGSRRLRVAEVAQLGDKRVVALVDAAGKTFLIGASSQSVTLLATLPAGKQPRRTL